MLSVSDVFLWWTPPGELFFNTTFWGGGGENNSGGEVNLSMSSFPFWQNEIQMKQLQN